MYNIKIINKNNEFYGKTLKGNCAYYDVKHTGNSDNLYIAITKEGQQISLLSSEIDEEYYNKQLLEEEIKRLGANIRDKVFIVKQGSVSFKPGWKTEGVHVITNIDYTGNVEFDNGQASIFRPTVKKLRRKFNDKCYL